MSDNNNPWEREVVTQLAEASLKEQRRSRRWGIIFKLLTFAYIGVILFMIGEASLTTVTINEKHTALVELTGVIADNEKASADHIVTALRDAFENENTAGIILRINSPGGSPVQSGYIYDEILRLREKNPDTPLYAVVTDICASGGYYIASGNTFVTDTLYSSTPFYAAQGNFFCQGERVKVIAGVIALSTEFEYSKENLTVSFNNNSLSADSYHWDFGDNTSDIVENPIHSYSDSGEYEVMLTANNNYCDESSTYTSIINIYEDSVKVYEDFIKVYPNPVRNKLFIEFTNYNSKNIEIQIINSLGQIADIKTFVIDNDCFIYTYDTGSYRTGIYFIKLIFEDKFHIYEIMKF